MIENEQAVIGSVLLDERILDDLVDVLTESDFTSNANRVIWRAMLAMQAEGKAVDFMAVAEYLDGKGELEKVGGLSYIGALHSNTPGTRNALNYAKAVREKAIARKLEQTANDIAKIAADKAVPTIEKLDKAQSLIMALAEQREGSGPQHVSKVLPKWVDELDRRFNSKGDIIGLPTGFADLDSKMSGLNDSDLIIIAGRPSMGKTSFAMNIAENVSVRHGFPVAVFSMEMPTEQLITRSVSSIGKIPLQQLRSGKVSDDNWPKVLPVTAKIKGAPLFIDETPGLSPVELRARARRLKRSEGIRLIVVDYLQLMTIPGMHNNKVGEVSEISRQLKSLAKELHVPVIALSQLNRGLEQRPNKRPRMADLRESGAIEQDADVILAAYRDEVYDENSPDKGTAEIIILKQRNGSIGTVRLAFLGDFVSFQNFDTREQWAGAA